MTTTVVHWTGLEAKALRAALRMTMHEFANYLGVGKRTVAKWEARGSDIQPLPQTQAILDTALAKASSDVQARFTAAVNDSLARRTTAVALNNGGMAEAALPLTQAVLQVDPTNPTALKLLIWNHLMVGDYPSALEAAHLYLPTYPRDSNTRWAVALAHLGGGDNHKAVHTAQDAVAADPDDVTVWNLLGYLHRLGGDEAAAHNSWSTGIEHVAARAGIGARHNLRVQ
ncbi:MAG: hypothetical protein ACRDSZ_18545 [Pseudonocardiaceae bacterium]